MMIEEKLAHRILHQQKVVIAKQLERIQETMRDNYAREDLLNKNELSPLFGESGIEVHLKYDKRCRSWSLWKGTESSKEDWRDWVGYGFLYYDDCDLDELVYDLVENCIADAIQEYQQENGYEVAEEYA